VHQWDDATELLAQSVIGYAVERLTTGKDTTWGAQPPAVLAAALDGTVSPDGIGGHEALRLFRDVLLPACRPMDTPMNLAYVGTAPTPAANLFDLVVSASSIFAGFWEGGAGAIAAENEALHWLADLAGFPEEAGGCFVSGGSAANLSALVTARHTARIGNGTGEPRRWAFAATSETHASAFAAGRVMDADVLIVPADERGRMTAAALRATLDAAATEVRAFAVVATFGTTNAGAIDDLPGISTVCRERGLWLHIDAAYGGAALCAPSVDHAGFEHADSFGVDPHKWLFAPYDCAALVYRDPAQAAAAHTQHGDYLGQVDRAEWNPADYAFHLSRRARGLPLWFSLATYGTDAYREAVEAALTVVRQFAAELERRDEFRLLLDPTLSVALFQPIGWNDARYVDWSQRRAREGVALILPTSWRGERCYRICVVNPLTTLDELVELLDDMARFGVADAP